MTQFVILYATSSGFGDENIVIGNVKLRVMNVLDKLKDYPIIAVNIHEFVNEKLYRNYDKESTIYVANKGSFQYIDALIKLKKFGHIRYLVSDMIDHSPKKKDLDVCDLHIASSISQYAYYKSLGLPVKHVIHGFDDYFIRPNHDPPNELKIAYIGASDTTPTINFPPNSVQWVNTCDWLYDGYWTDDLSKLLSKKDFDLMNRRKGGKWIELIQRYLKPPEEIKHEWKDIVTDYSFHWGTRLYDPYAAFKPFTKGFTASVLKCPILVDHWQYEARYYLPKDYPFFTDKNRNPESVEDCADVLFYVKKIEKLYHSKQWDYSLDCMEELYRKCSERKVFKDWVNCMDWMESMLIKG